LLKNYLIQSQFRGSAAFVAQEGTLWHDTVYVSQDYRRCSSKQNFHSLPCPLSVTLICVKWKLR